MSIVIPNTPWEEYTIDEYPVWVKREDLCCMQPGPSFSKIRGVAAHLHGIQEKYGNVPIGVLDTYHSKAGRGVAWVCKSMGMPCYNFYPVYKKERTGPNLGDHSLRLHQQMSAKLGAQMVPLSAGRSAILYHQAKKQLYDITDGEGILLPNGLKLIESVNATSVELVAHTPEELLHGTWVVSISSGTICAGVWKGLCDVYSDAKVIAHMGYSRSVDAARTYIEKMSGYSAEDISIIDEGYEYKASVDTSHIPFPCNKYYDAKAFNWLMDHIYELDEPVVFWNIGA